MTGLIAAIIVLYVILIGAFSLGVQRLPAFEPIDIEPEHDFSILVVFRNEKENLTSLIEHLRRLDYPREKFEVLLIDDDSEDGSVDLLKSMQEDDPTINMRVLEFKRESSSPKKEAIEMGLGKASFDWIVTTDADCVMGSDFLKAYDQFLTLHATKLVAGPVVCSADDSFLQGFQVLDFLSLQGSTMGGFGGRDSIPLLRPFMCNGANLCYDKKAFLDLGGYEGNKDIASGDDVFLLEKMLEHYESEVHFIKSGASLVMTGPKETWKSLASQRIRWAAKSTSYENRFAKTVGILVLTANFSLVMGLALGLAGQLEWPYLGLLFLLKINVDFALIYSAASILGQQNHLKSFVSSSLVYPFFVLWVAFQSLRGGYEWKGRSHKK